MIYDNALIVATQVLVLFLLIGVGYWTRRKLLIDGTGLRQLTNLLLVVVTPFMIIKAFQMPYDPGLLRGLLISLLSAVATHVLGIAAGLFLWRQMGLPQRKVLRFGIVFSNSAFMCLPLLQAVLGDRGVFYGSVYVAVFYMLQWTYGVVLMTGQRKQVNLQQAFLNPGMLGIVIGLGLFLADIRLPAIPNAVISHLANLNTPLAMLVIGGTLAMTDLSAIWRNRQIWLASTLRLLVIPLVILGGLVLARVDFEVLTACLIPASAPTAAAAALFATRYEQDSTLASHLVALSTLLSIITMPALIMLGSLATA